MVRKRNTACSNHGGTCNVKEMQAFVDQQEQSYSDGRPDSERVVATSVFPSGVSCSSTQHTGGTNKLPFIVVGQEANCRTMPQGGSTTCGDLPDGQSGDAYVERRLCYCSNVKSVVRVEQSAPQIPAGLGGIDHEDDVEKT